MQGGRYPYVYVDGIYLRRNWGAKFKNVAILVAIAVNEDGYCEVLGAVESMKEDKASQVNFFQWLCSRGPDGVNLIVGDKCLDMLEAVEDGFEETLTYCDFPGEHWTRICTNNVIERLKREIRRRTRGVGSFLDGNPGLMLVCARLNHVAGSQWGNKKYMNMKYLEVALEDTSLFARGCKPIYAKLLKLPVHPIFLVSLRENDIIKILARF